MTGTCYVLDVHNNTLFLRVLNGLKSSSKKQTWSRVGGTHLPMLWEGQHGSRMLPDGFDHSIWKPGCKGSEDADEKTDTSYPRSDPSRSYHFGYIPKTLKWAYLASGEATIDL